MALALPNTIENDTAADAAELQANFTEIQTYVNTSVLQRDGSVALTEPLLLPGDPTQPNHAVNKDYVDALFPIGIMLPYCGTTVPGGSWAICDGASMGTAVYPLLFAVLGYRYGGTGASFNLPNMAARTPIGRDSSQVRFDTTGKIGGSFTAVNVAHTHAIDHNHASATSGVQSANHTHSVPAHAHTINHDHASSTTGANSADHTHSTSALVVYQGGGGNLGLQAGGTGDPMNLANATTGANSVDHTHAVNLPSYSGSSGNSAVLTSGTISASHSHSIDLAAFTGTSGSQGTVGAEQIPPFVVVHYIIRYD